MSQEEPGKWPYTRGIRAQLNPKRPWTIRQYAGFSTAKESNKRYKELLSKGKDIIYRFTVYTPQEEMKQILFEDKDIRLDRHLKDK